MAEGGSKKDYCFLESNMTNSFRTFLLMATLTVLFVLVGGFLGGENGALITYIAAAADTEGII